MNADFLFFFDGNYIIKNDLFYEKIFFKKTDPLFSKYINEKYIIKIDLFDENYYSKN